MQTRRDILLVSPSGFNAAHLSHRQVIRFCLKPGQYIARILESLFIFKSLSRKHFGKSRDKESEALGRLKDLNNEQMMLQMHCLSLLWNFSETLHDRRLVVVIKFIAPKIEDTPAKWRLKIAISTAPPEWA